MIASKGWTDKPFYHPDAAPGRITFDAEASRHAEILITACGLDPKKATFADMESLSVHVECLACKGKKRLAMGWRAALLHSLNEHGARLRNGEQISSRWSVVKNANDLKRIMAEELRPPLWQKTTRIGLRCTLPNCNAHMICLKGQRDAFDWHSAVAHKNLSRASDTSMVSHYLAPVQF
ncbi:uncharacterized protein SCHCODRAFT_02517325 [Schizophyllum commune H4-8]|uniref:Expressed protein n=1 Tax=Schizophyllum commune (strain H4-8 / FGSC 9210) TaxID=578458 RepID=D8QM34_SCHCM|nr:uncharacterized protein SCHCODRAFT_02517325 [Schizophyllum commune H4-8]KAI5886543.1 hypothetical protein SCHCODRAFT_02517325 [Schizophyllum commune H4-8]